MVTLQTVEVPGYREAVKKEAALRDTAWVGGNELVCGIEVRPLNMRTVLLLERAMNGFMVPCRFDNSAEAVAHAIQVLYFSQPGFRAPTSPKQTLWRVFTGEVGRQRFIAKVTRLNDWEGIVRGVRDWVDDAFFDAPVGSGDSTPAASFASWPAYIFDLFAEAGLTFTEEEIMEMPMRRLFQHWRLAARRLRGSAIANPSDEIVCNHLAGVKP